MKLLIREFLASLRERDELDAILPDVLSELGFHVFSRPGKGTTQYGVDVGAVGTDEHGDKHVYLISIKQGDLTRNTWNGPSEQAVRPSLEEIRDAYIPTRLPKRYADYNIKICVCVGGEVKENVQTQLENYLKQNTTTKVSYEVWNGDLLAGLIMSGILGENVILDDLRSHFRKAIALVDEPDVSFTHFSNLVSGLHAKAGNRPSDRVRVARQLHVALWVLYVWARDTDNLEAPYLASELVALHLWDLARHSLGKKTKQAKQMHTVFTSALNLHVSIADQYLTQKILPHVGKRHGLSIAVNSRSPVDVKLKLFETLGRMAQLGIWQYWVRQRTEGDESERCQAMLQEIAKAGFKMIHNNPSLRLPLTEDQTIDVTLFLMLAASSLERSGDVHGWLVEMANQIDFSVRTRGQYPCIFQEYRALLDHPKDNSQEYLEEATSGSILIPTIAAWLSALEAHDAVRKLATLKEEELPHCTLQLWLPDANTEDRWYTGNTDHGEALANLMIGGNFGIVEKIYGACEESDTFDLLSCCQAGFWPLVTMACRHYRMPVPPHLWVSMLRTEEDEKAA